MSTRTVSATEFKAQCLALIDEVERTGDEIVVTKRGRPFVRVAPVREQRWTSLLGSVRYASDEDIIGPVLPLLCEDEDEDDGEPLTVTFRNGPEDAMTPTGDWWDGKR